MILLRGDESVRGWLKGCGFRVAEVCIGRLLVMDMFLALDWTKTRVKKKGRWSSMRCTYDACFFSCLPLSVKGERESWKRNDIYIQIIEIFQPYEMQIIVPLSGIPIRRPHVIIPDVEIAGIVLPVGILHAVPLVILDVVV